MKALIILAALATSNLAIAAPQTIYFAGNVYSGSIVNSDAGVWESTPIGAAFSGSITVNGSKNAAAGPSVNNLLWSAQFSNGLTDAVVSNFVFNYDGASYSRLFVPPNSGNDSAFLTKTVSVSEQTFPPFGWAPLQGTYGASVDSQTATVSNTSGAPDLTRISRALGLTLQGTGDFAGDVFDLSALPNLASFDSATSEISFFDTRYTCQFIQDVCVDGTGQLGKGSINLYGRLSFLSTAPFQASEVSEPGSILLVTLGLVGLAGMRRKVAINTAAG